MIISKHNLSITLVADGAEDCLDDMVTYVVVVVVVTLVLIVVVVVVFVFVVVVVPINIVVVVVVVVIIDIRRVSSGFIVRIWSDWNDVLHLAGRRCRHKGRGALRHNTISSGHKGSAGIMDNISGGGEII